MLYQNNFYLPSNKFYAVPAYKDYLQAKKDTLESQFSNYQGMSTQEKWTVLMEAFKDSLQENDMSCEELKHFRQELSAFTSKRKETAVSYYNLSLQQCVNYFEEFLFLYTNTDARYQLNSFERKTLLKAIQDALGTCETGINGRFYTTLQDHRKDGDWMQTELAKARNQVMHLLHQAYGDSDVHTYNKLVELANKEHLGITTAEEIWDVYAHMIDTTALQTFFNKHYPAFFEQYEQQATDNLTHYYLDELISTLQLDKTLWEKSSVTFSADKTVLLQRSIDAHFNGVKMTEIVHSVGDMSEDYLEFTLKSKKEIQPIIKRLVSEKLVVDQYWLSLHALKNKPDHVPDVWLKKGISLEQLLHVNESLQQHNHATHHVLSQNVQLLIQYPELLLSHIETCPDVLMMVPRQLKTDTRFIEAAMIILDLMLCEASTDHDPAKMNLIITQMLSLIGTEHHLLQTLSAPLLKNAHIAKVLLDNNPLFFGYLDPSLQNQSELFLQASQAASFNETPISGSIKDWMTQVLSQHSYLLWHLPKEYQKEPFLLCPVKPVSYQQALTSFLRIKAFHRLITPDQISASDFLQVVGQLNPELLVKVIEYRQKNAYLPLPFFEDKDAMATLQQFNRQIKTQLNVDWSDEYWSIRQKACRQQDPDKVSLFLAQTDNWFAGFKSYQNSLSFSQAIWTQWIKLMNALYRLALSLLKISLSFVALTLLPYLTAAISPFFWYGLIGCLLVGQLNRQYWQNPLVGTGNELLWRILFLDWELYFLCMAQLIFIPFAASYQSYHVLHAAVSIVLIAFDAMLSCFKQNENLSSTLEDTCDKAIVRLDSMSDASAHKKSDVLRELLSQMKADVQEQKCTFKESIEQKYPVWHQNQQYKVSFAEIAAKRRLNQHDFTLENASEHSFFFRPTPSTKVLIDAFDHKPENNLLAF